jgi:hypothetical protein
MKKTYPVSIAVAALLGSAAAAAADGVEACRQLDDDSARLACYDAQFGRAEAPPAPAPEAAPPAAAAAPVAAPAAKTEDDFGSEQLPVEPVDRIDARLVGEFNGWTGRTKFALDNGQVWQQTRNYVRNYEPREPIPQAKVTITRSFAGSYKLRIEGVRRTVQVKRIE